MATPPDGSSANWSHVPAQGWEGDARDPHGLPPVSPDPVAGVAASAMADDGRWRAFPDDLYTPGLPEPEPRALPPEQPQPYEAAHLYEQPQPYEHAQGYAQSQPYAQPEPREMPAPLPYEQPRPRIQTVDPLPYQQPRPRIQTVEPLHRPEEEPGTPPTSHDHPLVRPYTMTGGRTRPRYQLAIEALVSTTADPQQVQAQMAEHQRICQLCWEIKSVAEISALLTIPLGVARVLVADLAEAGLVAIHQPGGDDHAGGQPDVTLLERVLSGLRKL